MSPLMKVNKYMKGFREGDYLVSSVREYGYSLGDSSVHLSVQC
jgi:hypothetical protein